jgi:hypothetical protein
MNHNHHFLLLITLVLFSNLLPDVAHGQRFKAMGILGANTSQIDGDTLYGFKKLGISAGARLSYSNEKTWDIALEMLYSQRGSSEKLFNSSQGRNINLNFIEWPVIFSLRDWYQESDKYYKVRAEGGLSYGYLFGAEANGYDVSEVLKHDVSWLLAAGINFTKRLGMSVRYTSSFMNLYNGPRTDIRYKSYFLTFLTEYQF